MNFAKTPERRQRASRHEGRVRIREGHPVRGYSIYEATIRLADGERMARIVEVVRSYGATVVLAPQAYEGMGGDQAAARILNAAHTIFLHAVPEPERIVRAAGTRLAIERSELEEGPALVVLVIMLSFPPSLVSASSTALKLSCILPTRRK